jgi:hypothetical protein
VLPVSATLPALLAGALGLPAGTAARALAQRHLRRPLLARAPLPELATTLLWALLALRVWPSHPAALPAYLALGLACVVLVAIDVDSRLLPDRITYPAFGLVAVLLLVASLVEHDLGRMPRALEAAGVTGAFMLALALLEPGGLGLGDVFPELTRKQSDKSSNEHERPEGDVMCARPAAQSEAEQGDHPAEQEGEEGACQHGMPAKPPHPGAQSGCEFAVPKPHAARSDQGKDQVDGGQEQSCEQGPHQAIRLAVNGGGQAEQ